MVNFLNRMPRIAGASFVAAAVFAATLLTASTSLTNTALASDSIVAATLAEDALVAETAASSANNLSADATPALKKTASIDAPAMSDSIAKASLNANATMAITRRRAATAPIDRRIAPARISLDCSGVWCGRHMVLMLGTAF